MKLVESCTIGFYSVTKKESGSLNPVFGFAFVFLSAKPTQLTMVELAEEEKRS